MSIGRKNKRIYFDYAASTPVDRRVLHAMEPYFSEKFGNPGSLHSFGQEAIAVVDASRETIARVIGAKRDEIIFTGSATEANNLAIRGIARRIMNNSLFSIPRVIVSAVEHESVLETARDLEKDGAEIIYLPVDGRGIVDLGALKNALNERTILVSVMYANNEIGTVQPISEVAEIVQEFRILNLESRKKSSKFPIPNSIFPLLHTDAAQAFQFLDCDVNRLGADLMTLSAHKIYGPKGVGGLYIRSREKEVGSRDIFGSAIKFPILPTPDSLSPVVTGGSQEFGLRSGTENVPGIVGFAKAVKIVSGVRSQESRRIGELRDYFWWELQKICPETELNGPQIAYPRRAEARRANRIAQSEKNDASRFALGALPNILNVYFPNHEAQFLLTKLDMAGVVASSGSACRSRAIESSYVIEALGHAKERAKRSVRFSFGRPTTKEEIDDALKIIKARL